MLSLRSWPQNKDFISTGVSVPSVECTKLNSVAAVGTAVGVGVGLSVGAGVGLSVGAAVGPSVGAALGALVGGAEGLAVGELVATQVLPSPAT